MPHRLERETRLRLCAFACAFAWADLAVQPEERAHLMDLMERLHLAEADRAMVHGWLRSPPAPDLVDPNLVPHDQRTLFLTEAEDVVRADGVVKPEEDDAIVLLKRIFFPKTEPG